MKAQQGDHSFDKNRGQAMDEVAGCVENRQQLLDHAGLMQAARMAFPEILSMNLTKGTYRIIQYDGATTIGTPREGPLEQMLLPRFENVAPEDQNAFKDNFFLEGQLRAIQEGKEKIQLTYRRRGRDGIWHWMESIVIHQENPYDDDILTFAFSRNVDQPKAQEELLQQALADSAEKLEDWVYYNGLSNQALPGLIYINYDDGRPSPYVVGTLAKRLGIPANELAMGTGMQIHPEDRDAVKKARAWAKKEEASAFFAEYRVVDDIGEDFCVSNQAISFTDKDGGQGYVHFLTDVTYEHALTEQIRLRMQEKEKEQQQIFRIVSQHSNRTLYVYDLNTCMTRPWSEEDEKTDTLAHLYMGKYVCDELENTTDTLSDSVSDVKKFFEDIHGGVPSGEMKVHLKLSDGQLRWYHFKYSSILDGGRTKTALVSVEDITERHEHELAYLRHVQSIESGAEGNLLYVESCLICDQVENLAGLMLSEEERQMRCAHSVLGRLLLERKFEYEEAEESARYFSCENLLELYAQGQRQLRSVWKVRFLDGTTRWLDTEVVLMEEPYNGHVKAYIRMLDVTEEREEQLSIIQQAEYDAMTGLLRRGVGETKIRKYLAARTKPGGILIALDLDDLKGINDTLGHAYGDRAIIGIADALKKHFRKGDILVRAGGDEFLVFLPGAGGSVESVKASVDVLLRRLSNTSIGDAGGRTIHCSVGCAVELPDTDTFESLYQRADIALYHVKRNGKNHFAFFEPCMLGNHFH